jgi:hypothetical protein
MNNTTYELLTSQLHDKDQKMIDLVKRIEFLERLVEKNGQDSNPYRDDINYHKAGCEFLEAMDEYISAQQDDMLFDPSEELPKLYEDLSSIYWNITS